LFSNFGEEDDGQFDDEEMNGVEDQAMEGMDEEDVDARTAAEPNKPTESSETERGMFGRALVIR
jgi:TATA-binding protein-associated factor Taf7